MFITQTPKENLLEHMEVSQNCGESVFSGNENWFSGQN